VGIWCGADEAEVESHEKQDASPAPALLSPTARRWFLRASGPTPGFWNTLAIILHSKV
jgi:hypothetical protein